MNYSRSPNTMKEYEDGRIPIKFLIFAVLCALLIGCATESAVLPYNHPELRPDRPSKTRYSWGYEPDRLCEEQARRGKLKITRMQRDEAPTAFFDTEPSERRARIGTVVLKDGTLEVEVLSETLHREFLGPVVFSFDQHDWGFADNAISITAQILIFPLLPLMHAMQCTEYRNGVREIDGSRSAPTGKTELRIAKDQHEIILRGLGDPITTTSEPIDKRPEIQKTEPYESWRKRLDQYHKATVARFDLKDRLRNMTITGASDLRVECTSCPKTEDEIRGVLVDLRPTQARIRAEDQALADAEARKRGYKSAAHQQVSETLKVSDPELSSRLMDRGVKSFSDLEAAVTRMREQTYSASIYDLPRFLMDETEGAKIGQSAKQVAENRENAAIAERKRRDDEDRRDLGKYRIALICWEPMGHLTLDLMTDWLEFPAVFLAKLRHVERFCEMQSSPIENVAQIRHRSIVGRTRTGVTYWIVKALDGRATYGLIRSP
jgi:hypothetical protein